MQVKGIYFSLFFFNTGGFFFQKLFTLEVIRVLTPDRQQMNFSP